MPLPLLSLLVTLAGPVEAKTPPPWCAPELKALSNDICAFEAPDEDEGPRVLVVFLHGLVKTDSRWQHHHQRIMVRGAKREGYSLLMPRGIEGGHPHYPGKVGWPVTAADQKKYESPLFAQWKAAQRALEKEGSSFDRVLVVGFSSGAYYGASLALRGAFEADGYAVFAGGGPWGLAAKRRAPIFVGICEKDRTAGGARLLVEALENAKWPHAAESREVGHELDDDHLDHAITYLRTAAQPDG